MRRLAVLVAIIWTMVAKIAAYDYSSACARPYRSSRAHALTEVPCDLTQQSYCTTPGNTYPWHAVRRFVHENQGLMRRMYGEQRHISVLKAEIENEIDDDDYLEEEMQKAASLAEDIIKTKIMYTKMNHGRSLNVKPHFRPIQTTPSSALKNKVKTSNETIQQSVKMPNEPVSNVKANDTSKKDNVTLEITNNETLKTDDVSYKTSFLYKEGTKLESIANIEINNLDPGMITLEAVIKQTIETNSVYPNYPSSSKSEPLFPPEPTAETFEDIGIPSTTIETIDDNLTESTTISKAGDSESSTTTDSTKEAWKPMNVDTSTLPPTLLFSEHEKLNKNEKVEGNETEKVKEEFHLKPQHQESVRPTILKLRGVNACAVKEEVAAPFWANSTRGEVLALLNMYPFEQYVHLETCTHERKQMYCRDGCRCEQQYRLHRLLAYDPRNECRGIFADWFRFPSCCVCKCYDVPLEYRVTSRSPRVLAPQYDEDVKRAIYEDVARDWYTISTYDDEDEL